MPLSVVKNTETVKKCPEYSLLPVLLFQNLQLQQNDDEINKETNTQT